MEVRKAKKIKFLKAYPFKYALLSVFNHYSGLDNGHFCRIFEFIISYENMRNALVFKDICE